MTDGTVSPGHAEVANVALRLVGDFALVQTAVTDALDSYIARLVPEGVARLAMRSRYSDDEICKVAVSLAREANLPLHTGAFTVAYQSVKTVRDRFAHGALLLPTIVNGSGEAAFVIGRREVEAAYSAAGLRNGSLTRFPGRVLLVDHAAVAAGM